MSSYLVMFVTVDNVRFFISNAIILFRAPQLHNKFEPNFVKFEGKSKEDLNEFVKKS